MDGLVSTVSTRAVAAVPAPLCCLGVLQYVTVSCCVVQLSTHTRTRTHTHKQMQPAHITRLLSTHTRTHTHIHTQPADITLLLSMHTRTRTHTHMHTQPAFITLLLSTHTCACTHIHKHTQPAFITLLLTKVSGIPIAEERMDSRFASDAGKSLIFLCMRDCMFLLVFVSECIKIE